MRSPLTDVRCNHCDALLAKRDGEAIVIRRGPLQASVAGRDFEVALTCYRCATLQRLSTQRTAPRAPRPESVA